MEKNYLNIAMAQIAPIWLNKEATIAKVEQTINLTDSDKCDLLVFGEGLIPGYPFWLSITNASEFNSEIQKEIHAHYLANAVEPESTDLQGICNLAKEKGIAIYLGIIEKAKNRGGHSLYCSLVYISKAGTIESVHRKLQPTYEERLSWSPGDGHGLQVHELGKFKVGGLNCWENWMPLARTALYGLGENVHIAVWPGCVRNTIDITRFIAQESRSYVVSVSSLWLSKDIPIDIPHRELIMKNYNDQIANGGSCIAQPNGEWLIEPTPDKEGLIYAQLDLNLIYKERQNFDPCGHYSRPDVTQLLVNRKRQSAVIYNEED